MGVKLFDSSYFILKAPAGSGEAALDRAFEEKDVRQIGPLNKNQVNEALHRGFVNPHDLVWTPGLSKWKPANELFTEFFNSRLGNQVVSKYKLHQMYFTTHALPAAKLDFFLQILVCFCVGAGLNSFDLSIYFALFLGPLLYWLFGAFVVSCRSFGMLENKFCYFYDEEKSLVSAFDFIVRGFLSFFLILFFGIEFHKKRQEGRLLSDAVLGFVVQPYKAHRLEFVAPQSKKKESEEGTELTRTQLIGETSVGEVVARRREERHETAYSRPKTSRGHTRAVL